MRRVGLPVTCNLSSWPLLSWVAIFFQMFNRSSEFPKSITANSFFSPGDEWQRPSLELVAALHNARPGRHDISPGSKNRGARHAKRYDPSQETRSREGRRLGTLTLSCSSLALSMTAFFERPKRTARLLAVTPLPASTRKLSSSSPVQKLFLPRFTLPQSGLPSGFLKTQTPCAGRGARRERRHCHS